MADQAQLLPEDYKCWICLCTSDESPPHHEPVHEWRRPCKCNLVAHEACLLDWSSEIASKASLRDTDKSPECPQCKSPIHIKRTNSKALTIRRNIEALNSRAFQVLFFSSVGGSVASAVYTGLYTLGAVAIRCVCPSKMALKLLGVAVTDQGIQLLPLSLQRMIMIPSIPLLLLISGSRTMLSNMLIELAVVALCDRRHPPWALTGPRATLMALSIVRLVYHKVYDLFVDPFIQLCASRIRPWHFHDGVDPDPQENNMGINFRLVIEEENPEGQQPADQENIEQVADDNPGGNLGDAELERDRAVALRLAAELNQQPNNEAQRAAGAENQDLEQEGFFTRMVVRAGNYILDQIERALPPQPERDDQRQLNGNANPQEIQRIEAAGADGNGNDVEGDLGVDDEVEQPVRRLRHRNADWVISPRSLSLRVGYTLLWPLLGGIVGGLISRSPLIRKLCPGKFNRNILGGLLVVFIRDIVNLSSAFLRVRQENSRRILNYNDLPK